MRWWGLNSVFFLYAVCTVISPAFSQTSLPPEILNTATEPISYCNDSVFVASGVTIQNLTVTDSAGGIKVSVINYNKDEDTLGYIPVEGMTYSWNDAHGYLLIGGIESEEKYQEAVRKVYYKNVAENPTLGIRKFTITLNDADYLPLTGHFYRYIKKLNITWTESKETTDTMSYYGLQGYLVTITSEQENDFVWTKMDGIGWIGASDSTEEGVWKWVTGPETGQQFWQGNQNGQAVNDMFSFWAQGEPNNAYGGQSYAHINQHPGKAPKSWNDLRNDGSESNPLYYTPQGYVVEFGGMPGDPDLNLVVVSEVDVSKIALSNKRDYDICYGTGVELNASASDEYDYMWSPDLYIDNIHISSPFVNPEINSTYKVISKYGSCIDSAVFKVNVDPSPIALFEANPSSVLINDPVIWFANLSEGAESFEWNFSDNSLVSVEASPQHQFSAMGFYNVHLTAWNEFGCIDTISRLVTVGFDKIYPPTAFSPNALLEEDREFRLYAEGISDNRYHLLIFNRWGEIIFESNSPNVGWKGKMKNDNFAPTGVYTWVIQYLDLLGIKHTQQGTVTLLY